MPKFTRVLVLVTGISLLSTVVFSLDWPAFLLYQKNGTASNDRLGWSVSSGRDINGDGIPDFIIGAPLADPGGQTDAGSAFVYSGSDGSLLYRKDGASAPSEFGRSVAILGDIDGDGRSDFIVGSRGSQPGGSAFVYSGSDGSLLYRKDGGGWSDSVFNLGWSVAPAGDVDGDGRPDFIIGSSGVISLPGRVGVYSGATGDLIYEKETPFTYFGYFGYSVASAGDVNGDGRADFIVGDPANNGSAYVYSGANGSLLFQKSGAPLDGFGFSVASVGDVNGDGRSDFIIGAPHSPLDVIPENDSSTGSVYVYSGLDGSLIYEKHGAPGYNLGYSVASAGDVNGDGKPDFIVGAVGLNHFGFSGLGGVFVYSGADGSLLYEKTTNQYGLRGFSVASAGDINLDSRSDVIIGDPWASPGGISAGSAYVFVWDSLAPTISCSSDTVVSTLSGQCNRSVLFNASASDNLPGVSVDCTPPCGSTFQKGSSTVTCIATDAAENKDTCQFTVTVIDAEPPTSVCPSDIYTNASAGQCTTNVSYTTMATDNCPGASLVCIPVSGSSFSVGTTPISCIATDVAGNADTCTFNVFVTVTKGDMNSDSSLSPADLVLMLNCVFLVAGNCGLCFADVDCDGQLSPADVVIELNAVFLSTPITCTP